MQFYVQELGLDSFTKQEGDSMLPEKPVNKDSGVAMPEWTAELGPCEQGQQPNAVNTNTASNLETSFRTESTGMIYHSNQDSHSS